MPDEGITSQLPDPPLGTNCPRCRRRLERDGSNSFSFCRSCDWRAPPPELRCPLCGMWLECDGDERSPTCGGCFGSRQLGTVFILWGCRRRICDLVRDS